MLLMLLLLLLSVMVEPIHLFMIQEVYEVLNRGGLLWLINTKMLQLTVNVLKGIKYLSELSIALITFFSCCCDGDDIF